MINKIDIANMVFEGVSRSISVAPKYCTKIKHKSSPCALCYSICPVEAIEVGAPGETIKVDWEKCTGCGICISQCPTQSYKLRHGGYKKFIDNCINAVSPRGELTLVCPQYEGFTKNSATLDCVGILNMVDFLVLYLRGARVITIKYGICSHCESQKGDRVIDQEVRDLQTLRPVFEGLNNMEIVYESDSVRITFPNQFPIDRVVEEEKPNPTLNRRGVFSFFTNSLKEAALKSADMMIVEDVPDRTKIDFTHEETARRKMFLDSIMSLGKVTQRYVNIGRHFNSIEVDESCIYCGMCARFCNTGALNMNEERTRLTFNPSKCVSCKLCEKACYHNKLRYKDQLDLKDFFEDIVLAERNNPY